MQWQARRAGCNLSSGCTEAYLVLKGAAVNARFMRRWTGLEGDELEFVGGGVSNADTSTVLPTPNRQATT